MSLKIAGYTPRWHLKPGDVVPVHVSTEFQQFHAKLVRLTGAIRTATDWEGKVVQIPLADDRPYPGREVPLAKGSCLKVALQIEAPIVALASRLWFRALPAASATIIDADFDGCSIRVVANLAGSLCVRLRESGQEQEIACDLPALLERHWYDIAFVIDRTARTIGLVLRNMTASAVSTVSVVADFSPGRLSGFVLGGNADVVDGRFGDADVKVEAPRVWTDVPDRRESLVSDQAPPPLASWNLADMSKPDRVAETSGRFPDAHLINAPTRAVTSSAWRGQATSFAERPDLYAAVALHADDIDDAQWPVSFELGLPEDLISGVYCLVLSESKAVNYSDPTQFYPLPLFVVPGDGQQHTEIALVLPTFSYRAYSNNTLYEKADEKLFKLKGPTRSGVLYDYCIQHGLKSHYCLHDDGSGVHLASLKRPQATVRPDLVSQLHSFTHQLSADLEILEWLEKEARSYVILTDELLHEDGVQALLPYRVAITGSHPEYSTSEQLDAYSDYNASGGCIMYLGGNGFILRVTIDPARPWIQELRRGDGGGIWPEEPGEAYHQTDGRQGGLWRRIGRPPNVTFGLGFSAMGFTGDGNYRIPRGFNPHLLPENLSKVLVSIGQSSSFGIAGLELDCYDVALGSSPSAIVFGEVNSVPEHYVPVHEYLGELGIDPVEAVDDCVRGNLVWIPRGPKGEIFATGSIRWTSGLNVDGDPTSVRAITTAALADMTAPRW
ncbi:N,N-dimethylformamidase [Rhizobium mesoamericanum]|uniref:N,N-dimethylformamidase beta subunit family domain-containing protein n=1 Tax=Rhizobium mesoamericanum TaxID=1079800 RepID=UPI002787C2AB|nr:N,N-dimethylformamidase beta subunit family domain-containing protein [Rhizobium mesoamericanum]MDQ0563179.1 N,N-dimethylformamidase [Rhizobium mesoamericanum]